MRIYLDSLGCRLNAAESETMARQFAGGGACVVRDPGTAEIIVLNTCAVTAQAAHKSRHRLHLLHRDHPTARIAVVGCWATEDPELIRELPGVRWVIPNEDKSRALEIITGTSPSPAAWSPGKWGHTRAFLAVQDGCDHHCTYCMTTILRGPSRSRPMPDILADVNHLVQNGAQEVVLTGVSLGAYGKDPGLTNGLGTLVMRILGETDVPRLRLSSIEPWDVDDLLVEQWANPRLCRQLHLPLQSGTDAVLRRMGRQMTIRDYLDLVSRVRAVCPEIALTTDVIVGFPGESDIDFRQGLDFIRLLAFAKLHVFPYSEREGTAATHLPGSVDLAERRKRATQLRQVSDQLAADYRTGFIGKTLPVLYMRQRESQWLGISDNYLKVKVCDEHGQYNTWREVMITGEDKNAVLTGNLAGEE